MIKRCFVYALFLLLASCTRYEFEYLYEDLKFDMARVSRPQIPARDADITDFGAVGDGLTLNTDAITAAIDYLFERGGGHVIVPAGIWLTGPITLKDNIDLHVTEDAVLLFSTDRKLYPIVESVFEGLDTKRCIAPLNADGAKNISVTGGGTIDGNGQSWRRVNRDYIAPVLWRKIVAEGGLVDASATRWYPDSSFFRGVVVSDGFNVPQGLTTDQEWESVKSYLRPELLCFKNCENVLLEDCLFQNSPCWNLHPLMCRNLIIKNINVRNPWYASNGDGLDIDSCEDVIVVDSCFDVGDDAICIKSGKDEDGRRRARPCRNLIVNNCVVFHGHGGFVVGSEMSGGVENVSVTDCHFLGTDVGLRFKSRRGRGGVVRNIHIDNIIMTDLPEEPLLFDLHYQPGRPAEVPAADGVSHFNVEPRPADETTPQFRDIHISNILCCGASRAMFFNGIPEKNIENIVIENSVIAADKGADIRYADGVLLKGVKISQKEGVGYCITNSRNVQMEGCSGSFDSDTLDIFRYNADVCIIR